MFPSSVQLNENNMFCVRVFSFVFLQLGKIFGPSYPSLRNMILSDISVTFVSFEPFSYEDKKKKS